MHNDIIFPNLHITLHNVGSEISINGFEIAYYGITIAIAMIIAGMVILKAAKNTNQSEDDYLDYIIWGIVIGVIGARVYYVAFSFELYKDNLLSIFNLRQGGLAIYGGIIFGVLAVFILSKKKKQDFLLIADTAILGVPIAQAIGRYGNFFNREAFGQYSDGLFAMLLPIDSVRSSSGITYEMMEHLVEIDGVSYISVHPTFLYESIWNLVLFIILVLLHRYFRLNNNKPFNGFIFCLYLLIYGIGRFWIEALRTDQLLIPGTVLPVSRVLAFFIVLVSLISMAIGLLRNKG